MATKNLYAAQIQSRFGTTDNTVNAIHAAKNNIQESLKNSLEKRAREKELRLSARNKAIEPSYYTNRDADSFGVKNEGLINNLKSAANYLLPSENEFNKFEQDPITGKDYLLEEDTNKRLIEGKFDTNGDFRSMSTADIDSPLASSRVANIDSLENHIDLRDGSKYDKIKKNAGYSNKQMLELGDSDYQKKMIDEFATSNPDFSFEDKGKDYFNRDLIGSDKYENFMLSKGAVVPSRDSSPEKIKLWEEARKNKLGIFATEESTKLADEQYLYNKFGSKKDEMGLGEKALNTGKAFGKAVADQVVGLVDFVGEATGIGDLGTEEEKNKMTKDLFNYNSKADEESAARVGLMYDRIKEFGLSPSDIGDVGSIMYNNPEMIGTSLGYILPFLVSAPLSIAGKASKAISIADKALKSKKITTAAHAAIISAEEAKLIASGANIVAGTTTTAKAIGIANEYKTLGKGMDVIGQNAGLLAFSGGKANDTINARVKENNGKDISGMEKAGIYVGSVFYNMIDRWSDMGILKSPNVLNALKQVATTMGKKQIVDSAFGLAKAATALGLNFAKEGSTEGVQEIMDILATKYKTETNGGDLYSLLKDNSKEIFSSSIMGVAGAGQFVAAGAAAKISSGGLVSGANKYNESRLKSLDENNVDNKDTIESDQVEANTNDGLDTGDGTDSSFKKIKEYDNPTEEELLTDIDTIESIILLDNYDDQFEKLYDALNLLNANELYTGTAKFKEYLSTIKQEKKDKVKEYDAEAMAALYRADELYTKATEAEESATYALAKEYLASSKSVKGKASKQQNDILLKVGQLSQQKRKEILAAAIELEQENVNDNVVDGSKKKKYNSSQAEMEFIDKDAIDKLFALDEEPSGNKNEIDNKNKNNKNSIDDPEYITISEEEMNAAIMESDNNSVVDTTSNNSAVIDSNINKKNTKDIQKNSTTDSAKNINVNTNTKLNSPTDQTSTHTVGLSERTINKLAKEFNLNNVDIQASLNSALGQIKIRKMKSVSAKSNDQQRDIYNGKNGILTRYAEYKKAIASRDKDKALTAIQSLQKRGKSTEQRMYRYATKYNEVTDRINDIIDAINIEYSGSDSETITDALISSLKGLSKTKFTPAGANYSISVKDVMRDMELDDNIVSALNIKDGESNAKVLISSMLEQVDHIDSLLGNLGHGRIKEKGYVVSILDDKNRYQEDIVKVEKKISNVIARIDSSKDKPTILSALKNQLKDYRSSLKNLIAGVDRINNVIEDDGSYTRYISKSLSTDVLELKEDIKKLEADIKKYDNPAKRIEKLELLKRELAETGSDEATLASINNNLGKQVGKSSVGGYIKADSIHDTGILANLRLNNVGGSRTTKQPSAISDNVESADEVFVAKQEAVATKNIKTTLLTLSTSIDKIDTIRSISKSRISKLKVAQREQYDLLVDTIGSDNAKIYTKANSVIRSANKNIELAKTKLSLAQKARKKIIKSGDNAIKRRAKIIADESANLLKETMTTVERKDIVDGIQKQINDEISTAIDTIESDGNIGESLSSIKLLSSELLKSVKPIVSSIKKIRDIIYKMVQKNDDSELGKEISDLEDIITKSEASIKISNEKINRIDVLNTSSNGFNLLKKTEAITKKMNRISSLEKATRTSSRSRVVRLREKIKEIKESIKNDKLLAEWLRNGVGKKKNGESREVIKDKNKEDQVIDLDNLIEFKATIFGAVPAEEFYELLDDGTNEQWLHELSTAMIDMKKIMHLSIGSNGTMDSFQLKDSPMSGLLFNKNGDLNTQFVAAIKIAALSWEGANGISNRYNDRDKIARMVGKLEGWQVTNNEYYLLKDAGTFRKLAAHTFGDQVFSLLGIKMKENTTEAMRDKLIADAGLMVLALMQQQDKIQDLTLSTSYISRESWNVATANKDGEAGIVIGESKNTGVGSIPVVKSKIDGMESEKYTDMYKNDGEFASKMVEALDIDSLYKNYKTRPTNKKDGYKVRGSIMDVPQKSQDILSKIESNELEFDVDSINMFNEVFPDDSDFLNVAGWKDLDLMRKANEESIKVIKDGDAETSETYLYDEIRAQEGRNRELEVNVSEMRDLGKKISDGSIDNKIFFEWFFSKNGRFMLDSAGVNPQVDKFLARWLITSKTATNTWEVGSNEWRYFKQGLAQAFGISIDKDSTDRINEIADELISKDEKYLIAAVKNGKIDLLGSEYEIEHPGHAIQAIVAMNKYHEATAAANKVDGVKFKAIMVSEYDSVTSGFINKLLQTPVLDDKTMDWIGKGGVFDSADDRSKNGMNDNIASKQTVDAYRTLVHSVVDRGSDILSTPKFKKGEKGDAARSKSLMDAMINDWIDVDGGTSAIQDMIKDGIVTSWARELFKFPFMTFGYAASVKTIAKNIGIDLSNDILKGIAAGRYKYDSDFMIQLGINSEEKYKQLREDLMSKNQSNIKIDGILLEETISKLFARTYGEAVSEVMLSSFSELVDVNDTIIDATKAMFSIFIARLKSETLKKESEVALSGNARSLTKNEVDEIVVSLSVEFPMFKAPNSETSLDGIAVIDTKLIDSASAKLSKNSIKINTKDGEVKTLSVQNMIREYAESANAGAVLPIHWIDGTIIGEVLKNSGVLGVHDAIVISSNFESLIRTMNKATYETGATYNMMNEVLIALSASLEAARSSDILNEVNPTVLLSGTLLKLINKTKLVQDARDKFYSTGKTVMNIADQFGSSYISADLELSDKDYNNILTKPIVKNRISKDKLRNIILSVMKEEC